MGHCFLRQHNRALLHSFFMENSTCRANTDDDHHRNRTNTRRKLSWYFLQMEKSQFAVEDRIYMAHIEKFTIQTFGKKTYEITDKVSEIVQRSAIKNGTVTVFIQHTSASLIIYENADPTARVDLENFFDKLVPENLAYFTHTYEGSDDMPSHIRMVLTRTSETIPIMDGRMCMGTWQGIFVFEHRHHKHTRSIVVAVQ